MNRWLFCLAGFLAPAQALYSNSCDRFPGFTQPLIDTIPPVIQCPPNDSVFLPSGDCSTAAYSYDVTATDNQPGVIVVQLLGLPSGAQFPVGTTVNWYVAVDGGGNNAQCSFNVVVQPAGVSLNCQLLVEVTLDSNCTYIPDATHFLEGTFGCPEAFIVSFDKTLPYGNGPWTPGNLGFSDIGEIYAFRVTDPVSGNSCWGQVHVSDEIPPKLVCPDINIPCVVETFTPAFLQNNLGLSNIMPIVDDNCYPAPNLQYIDQFHNAPCENDNNISGTVKRTWTATDDSGNTSTCIQTINRRRMLADVRIPADMQFNCMDTLPAMAVTGVPYIQIGAQQYPLVPDTYCEFGIFHSDSVAIVCPGSTRVVRTWTVYDACLDLSPNNPISGVQILDFVDSIGPEINCPTSLTVVLEGDSCIGRAVLPDFIAYENCSDITAVQGQWAVGDSTYVRAGYILDWPGNLPMLRDTLVRFDTLPALHAGLTVFTLTATDACGNTSVCMVPVNALDALLPVPHCAATQTLDLPIGGTAALQASALDGGSTDNCSALSFKAQRLDNGCGADGLWDDHISFCCSDAGDSVPVILRIYDYAVPAGPISPDYGDGRYSACQTKVWVTTNPAPFCEAPADTTVQCTEFDPTLEQYGMPVLSCSIDTLITVLDMSQFNANCQSGTLKRTFIAVNAAGDSAVCTQHIVSVLSQNYYVRFPDDKFVLVCDSSNIYGEPEVLNLACANIQPIYSDELFTVVPDACFKIERSWTVINWCSFDPNMPLVLVPNPNPVANVNDPENFTGPVVSAPGTAGPWAPSSIKLFPGASAPTNFSTYWSLNSNGYRYVQILKFVDGQLPVFTHCASDTLLVTDATANDSLYWNGLYISGGIDLCETQVNVSATATDWCSGGEISFHYLLELDLDGDGFPESVYNSLQPPLPGQVLLNGIPVTFDARPVPDNDKFRFYGQILTSGREKTIRLRWNTLSNPQNAILPQLPMGVHRITWYVEDMCGNEAVCTNIIHVNSTGADCLTPHTNVSGRIITEAGASVQFAEVTLSRPAIGGGTVEESDDSDVNGHYLLPPIVPYGTGYSVEPERLDLPLNGVTTYDLVLISQHILGHVPLNSPYKRIAADANHSNTITTFDIIELRKLILGIYNELPNCESWRFVDKNYVFPDPENPFQPLFPEIQSDDNLQPSDSAVHHFIGIKIGDLNNSVQANYFTGSDDRSAPPVALLFHDTLLQAGAEYLAEFRLDTALVSCQWTFEAPGFRILDVFPAQAADRDAFALGADGHALTVGWFSADRATSPVFRLRLLAQEAGPLSAGIGISGRITPVEACSADGICRAVVLQAEGRRAPALTLEAVCPNPFADQTRLYFTLGQPELVTLSVFEAGGRLLLQKKAEFGAGPREMWIDCSGLPAEGVLFFRLETSNELVNGKLLRILR